MKHKNKENHSKKSIFLLISSFCFKASTIGVQLICAKLFSELLTLPELRSIDLFQFLEVWEVLCSVSLGWIFVCFRRGVVSFFFFLHKPNKTSGKPSHQLIRIESMKVILKLTARQQIRSGFPMGSNPEGIYCYFINQMVSCGAKKTQFTMQ